MLTVLYKAQCEKGPVEGMVRFRFIGLKGHIWGFNAKPQ